MFSLNKILDSITESVNWLKPSEKDLFKAVVDNDLSQVKELINWGINVNATNGIIKSTPLSIAAFRGYLPIVIYLVEHGADINSVDIYQRTPLYFAVKYGNWSIAKYLVEHGADVNISDNSGGIPLNLVENNSTIVKLLVEHGSNINKIDIHGYTPLHHYVSRYPSEENILMIEYLIDVGADRSIKNNEGKTAADLASPTVRHIIDTRPSFDWSPDIHQRITSIKEKEQIKTLMTIRHLIDSPLSNIPRELMFELFKQLKNI